MDTGIPDQNIYPSVDIFICYKFGDSSFSFLFRFLYMLMFFLSIVRVCEGVEEDVR